MVPIGKLDGRRLEAAKKSPTKHSDAARPVSHTSRSGALSSLIPIGRKLRRINNSAFRCPQARDRGNVIFGKRKVKDLSVVWNSLDILSSRQRNDTRLLDKPTQHDLR